MRERTIERWCQYCRKPFMAAREDAQCCCDAHRLALSRRRTRMRAVIAGMHRGKRIAAALLAREAGANTETGR